MKKTLLSALLALTGLAAAAQSVSDGYYRVQNAVTKRYAYLTDNTGEFDAATTSADVNALQLWSGFLKASSDPATVFYLAFQPGTGSNYNYNVSGQGTSIYDFLGTYLKILPAKQYDGKQAYYAYATKGQFTKYLGDLRTSGTDEKGFPSVDAKGDNRLWYINSIVNSSDDAYFGIAPDITANGKYYYSFYAGFPFSAYSEGMNFYIIDTVDTFLEVAVLKPVTGSVPAGCPVIAECSGPLASDNKLNIGTTNYGNTTGNRLKGVYFNNDTPNHVNLTPNDKSSMRVLTVVNGQLTFAQASYSYMPANKSYLSLSTAAEQAVSSYKCMTQAEYEQYKQSLDNLISDGYYRMQNTGSGRYAALNGNSGSFGSTPNVAAFQLISDFLRESSDPASIYYLNQSSLSSNVSAKNLTTQGTSTDAVFNSPIYFYPSAVLNGMQTFYAVGSDGGNNWYLSDSSPAGPEYGVAGVNGAGDYRKWVMNKITDSNYFGITPTATAGGKYYASVMAGFPIAPASPGVKLYALTRIDTDMEAVVLKELTGVVAAGTPVIVECAGPLASDNKLTVGATGDAADVQGNLLQAVWFDSESNRTPYDAKTMRSLGVADGKVCFSASADSFIPRNQAYITLSGDAQTKVGSYELLTEAEYQAKVDAVTGGLVNGYYRFQNAATQRNMYLLDNKATVTNTGVSDLKAFQLISDILQAKSDPACIMQLTEGNATGSALDRNVFAQGSNFKTILNSYVKLLPSETSGSTPAYSIWIDKNGTKKYFGDSAPASAPQASLSLTAEGNAALWNLNAVDCESAQDFFGVVPTLTVDGKYYATLMASFPFQPYSEGMKVYGIGTIDSNRSAMVLKEYSGTIPAGTPVIIQCAGPLASDNRLAVGEAENVADVKGNKLSGVYFDFNMDGRVNQTAFDSSSMRMLGVADGKLVFQKANLTSVPRNIAYIVLSGSRPIGIPTFEVMTEEEYNAQGGVEGIGSEDAEAEYFNLQGLPVSNPEGIVIRRQAGNSEKVVK